jgi:hypothetical protein
VRRAWDPHDAVADRDQRKANSLGRLLVRPRSGSVGFLMSQSNWNLARFVLLTV